MWWSRDCLNACQHRVTIAQRYFFSFSYIDYCIHNTVWFFAKIVVTKYEVLYEQNLG